MARAFGLLTMGAASVLLAACASSGSGSPDASSGAPARAGQTGPAVLVRASGGHLITAEGRTLYLLSDDSVSHLACTDMCLGEWPPLTGVGRAAKGVDPAGLTVVQRGSGSQVVYHGHPLYEFSGDMNTGAANGVGLHEFGGTWSLVTTADVGAAGPDSAAPSSTVVGGAGGYDYP